jgi:hypothetical protein
MKNQKVEDMTWLEKVDLIRMFALFPAITVMVFIRQKVGFRLCRPTWLIVLTSIMLMVPVVFKTAAAPFGFVMPIYAITMLCLGVWHRKQRWEDFGSGVLWHTYSPGISYLEMLPFMPSFCKSRDRVRRFLDPAAISIIALLVGVLLNRALGGWLMFSALALFIYEQNLYTKHLAGIMDTYDAMCCAKAQEKIVEFLEGDHSPEQQCSIEDTVGIPTGIAPDIALNVENFQNQGKNTPDNLAPVSSARI